MKMSGHVWCVIVMLTIFVCSCVVHTSSPTEPPGPPGIPASREVKIKQGKLRGFVLKYKRGAVEIFLGIPYASPPVGSQRFMPPGSPPPWPGVRLADSFGPVCPQNPPDISNEKEALKAMSAGRYNYLKRLLPYLRNQSEDCLYLNIYAPSPGPSGSRGQPKYPVLVFIHGESYEWNAGNPYDGSVLASYGGVVVVTLNFRLGILGFLRPGIGGNTVSNFGLLDQVAALQWVKENIALFGGDPGSVTLLGHGTGAACANLLLVSPVSQAANGLFHRAILMSGTALADWALTKNPLKYTIQVAQALNCPLVERDDELAACLRRKRLSELLAVRVQSPLFDTPFGPVVDGSVVPNEPRLLMGVYKDLFSRYDLMYGVTEVESYHLLDAVSLNYGMLERERDELLKAYVTSRYELRTDAVFATILQRYGPDWQGMVGPGGEMGSAATAEQQRDVLLDVLSDARITAPLVQMADYHAPANPKSYLYVFTHRSKYGDFPGIAASVHGEELPYVFGVPLDGGRFHFPNKFAPQEALLAETVMTLWTNFAKTGNPNAPRKTNFSSAGSREWKQQELDWPEYDLNNQSFLRIGIPSDIRRHYRRNWMDFWNRDLPEMLEDPTNTKMASVKPRPVIKAPPPPPLPPPLTGWTQEPFYPDIPPPPFYPLYTPPDSNPHNENGDKSEHMDPPIDEKSKKSPAKEIIGDASSMALSIVIIIGVCFLMINCLAFSAIYYQRNRLRVQEQRILSSQGIKPATEMQSQPGRPVVSTRPIANSEDEDPQQRRRWLIRQCSGSTVDPQTKVRDWIAHEIVQRCSPRFLRRMPRNPGSTATSMDRLSSTTTLNRPAKVSVAVDATPLSRLENGSEELKPGETIILQRSSTCINLTPVASSSQTPSSFNTQCSPPSTTTSFQSQQQLSYPTPDELSNVDFYDQPMAYIHPLHNQDINVTSRRDDDDDGAQGGLSTGTMIAGDALDTIKRRKYPKVLPDNPVPEHSLIKRRSLPHPGHLELLQTPVLPISAPTTPTKDGQIKVPPPPPPRTSTLKREHNTPSNVVTQPRVVIKPSAVSKRPSDRGGPRVNPTLSPSSPGDSSDSSTGTIKRPAKPSNNQKSWYAQYNKAVSSPSDNKGTD